MRPSLTQIAGLANETEAQQGADNHKESKYNPGQAIKTGFGAALAREQCSRSTNTCHAVAFRGMQENQDDHEYTQESFENQKGNIWCAHCLFITLKARKG